jgi:hypothetical protein
LVNEWPTRRYENASAILPATFVVTVTTIPAAADVGLSIAYASWTEAWGSTLQLLLNVLVLITVGALALPQRAGGECAPQLRLHGCGRPQRRDLPAVRCRRARHHDAQQGQQGAPQGGRAGTARRSGERVGQQSRLRQYQRHRHEPEADGEDQVAPGDPGVT